MIRKPIDDLDVIAHIGKLPPDGMTIFTLEGDMVRGALLSGTSLVNRMRANHGLGPLETLVLGHAYLAAGLLSTTIKGDDKLIIQFDTEGPARGFSVEATARGEIRGRLFRNPILLDAGSESADIPSLFGAGSVTISKHSAAKTTPYIGTTALKPGSGVAEGLAGYFLESEQTRTSFVLSIHFDRMGRALGAGGLYLQALPGASDEALDRLERLMFGLPPPGPFFAEGKTRDLFMTSAFSFFDLNLLGEANAEFFCGCLREKMKIFIGAMPRADLEDMAVKGPFPAEVTCHNCGSVYHFEKEELEAMLVAR